MLSVAVVVVKAVAWLGTGVAGKLTSEVGLESRRWGPPCMFPVIIFPRVSALLPTLTPLGWIRAQEEFVDAVGQQQ